MKYFHALLIACTLTLYLQAQTGLYNQPWKDSTKAIIIDPYSENIIDWDTLLTDKRVVGVIHKASQGTKSDRLYSDRKTIAKNKGLLWGSYHLGTPGDPTTQADFYLGLTGRDTTELMALDLESLDSAKHMTLTNAIIFINRIYEKTGHYPLLYCNKNMLNEIELRYDSTSVFSKCGLWYARFRNDIPDFNTTVWPTYSLWQFSCEINCKKTGECLYNVPGTLRDIDVNVYNGTIEELRNSWPVIGK